MKDSAIKHWFRFDCFVLLCYVITIPIHNHKSWQPITLRTVNAKGWFVYIISHGSLTAQDKAFFIPWESFFIAACLQQAQFCAAKYSAPVGVARTSAPEWNQWYVECLCCQVLWLQHEKGAKISIYLAAKLSASPHGIKAYYWLNKVEPWMEFCSLGYTVLKYLSTNWRTWNASYGDSRGGRSSELNLIALIPNYCGACYDYNG